MLHVVHRKSSSGDREVSHGRMFNVRGSGVCSHRDFECISTGIRFLEEPFCLRHLRDSVRISNFSFFPGKFSRGDIVWIWFMVFLIMLVKLVTPSKTLLLKSIRGAKRISFPIFLVLL